jgi:hypothetical protein
VLLLYRYEDNEYLDKENTYIHDIIGNEYLKFCFEPFIKDLEHETSVDTKNRSDYEIEYLGHELVTIRINY